MGEIKIQSVNRNFVDTMSGLLGVGED